MLPADARVRTRAEFSRAFDDGRAAHGDRLSIRSVSEAGAAKLGFIVGKRVSAKATRRNRLKRQLRGLVRERYGRLSSDTLSVVIAKPTALGASYDELGEEFDRLARKLHLMT